MEIIDLQNNYLVFSEVTASAYFQLYQESACLCVLNVTQRYAYVSEEPHCHVKQMMVRNQ